MPEEESEVVEELVHWLYREKLSFSLPEIIKAQQLVCDINGQG